MYHLPPIEFRKLKPCDGCHSYFSQLLVFLSLVYEYLSMAFIGAMEVVTTVIRVRSIWKSPTPLFLQL